MEYSKNENSARSELEALYKQLGIIGLKVKRELKDRVNQLPEIYDRIAKHMVIVKPAIKYYSAFTQHIYENDNPLPLLKYVSGKVFFNSERLIIFIMIIILNVINQQTCHKF